MRIDLHTHSTVSDGTDTPAELVRVAAEAGLDVVALTDHDTAAGWSEAIEALPAGVTFVPGAELSCVAPDGRGGECTVHLLAYLYDPTSPALAQEQLRLRAERRTRLYRMARRMADDGLPIDPDALMAGIPEHTSAGRPHIAASLVRAGVVGSVSEAFDRYLSNASRYYVSRVDTPVRRAIAMIADAGGVTVLAHAFARSRGAVVTAEVIASLAGQGLGGLEVDHPDHDAPTRAELRGLAADLGLLVTGSSDYHGDNKLIPIGAESTPPETLDAMIERTTGSQVVRR